jgi:hypothetical protein
MSRGGTSSKSASNTASTTTTNTASYTYQYDQRVAATDGAIAIAPGASNINIEQIPESVDRAVMGLLDLNFALTQAAVSAGTLAADSMAVRQEETQADAEKSKQMQTYLLIGLAGLAAIALITRL